MRRNRALSSIVLLIGSLMGLLAFTWPLYLPKSEIFLFQSEAARSFAIIIALIAVGIVAIDISQGALDSKAVALLGVLSALIAALRLVGAGAVGIEPMWFLLIISAYVFGAKFGFSLGVIAMGISALITGGIGPWLPFQMLAAGWIGIASGTISKITHKFHLNIEIASLIFIGLVSSSNQIPLTYRLLAHSSRNCITSKDARYAQQDGKTPGPLLYLDIGTRNGLCSIGGRL